MAKLVIFVKTSKISVDLLKFVDENLAKINAKGVKVVVEKISGTSNEKCKKYKITRLPAMIDEAGTVHVGAEKIMKIFQRNLGRRRDDPLDSMYGVGESTPEDDAQAYLASLMFRRDGDDNLVPITTEEDSEDGESKDFSADMERFRSKTTSKRKSPLPPPPRRGRKSRARKPRDEPDESDSDDERADVAAPQTDADVEEEMREQMVRAWRDGGN